MGKSTIAAELARWLGCSCLVEEWEPSQAVLPGALHLTNREVAA